MDPRQRLAQLLGATRGAGSFSARRTAAPDNLHIEVTGVGPLTMPVTAVKAKQLIAVARPAQYGQGEQTLTDATVRYTWQVPMSRVRIDKRQWNRTLTPILEGIRSDLGLPERSRLKAELHSLLVYSPGQFFLPHQDSEKSDDMVGTLTVTLPGASRGGELIVQHGEHQTRYQSSDKLLSFVAFYADCRHEVQPVTSGYRVVLTYNLLLSNTNAIASTQLPGETAELAAYLEEHFSEHRRLVYLLDHQYTARGMSWTRLKGVDAERVRLLDAAAAAGGCEIALALADVHESWSAYEPDPRSGRGSYRYDDDDNDDAEEYELNELLDSSVGLSDWVDRSGTPAPPVATVVYDDEVSATTPTRTLAPYESEYEGFMGNYGNTMDRWYRRGAVVLWPTRLDFEVRAEASPKWALDTLQAQIQDGDLTRARKRAESLTSFWTDLPSSDALGEALGRKPDLHRTLAVANGLDDAPLAAMLLAPFRLAELTPPNAALLAALVKRYGESWTRTLLAGWNDLPRWRYASGEAAAWLAALPELCRALRDENGLVAARLVLAVGWERLTESLQLARAITQPSRRALALEELTAPITGVLLGAAISKAPEFVDAAVAQFADEDDEALRRCEVGVLRAMPQDDPEIRAGSGFDVLARNALAQLEAWLARPTRDPADWSIEPPGGCACALCVTLNDFLADPELRALDWPLKEQSRRHVHLRIEGHELPVKHSTRRVGRPHMLQLVKTPELFEREKQERQAAEADMEWVLAVTR